MNKYEYLKEINYLLALSEKYYSLYIENDAHFLYAKLLYKTNTKILDHILNNLINTPYNLLEEFLDLTVHIQIWTELWEENAKLTNPQLNSPFKFKNEHIFPKNACNKIINAFIQEQSTS